MSIIHVLKMHFSIVAEAYSESSRTSTMELFVKIAKGIQVSTIFAESSILDVRLDFEYVSVQFICITSSKIRNLK